MTIRDARLPQDEPAILSFITGLQDFEAAFEPNRSRDPNFAVTHWRDLQHVCAQKHGAMFIAEHDGESVGWAFTHEMHGELFIAEPERRHGFIAELYIVQSARGAGHGRALIAACEAWSHARGHKAMMIGVLSGNPRAMRAYEGAGFTPYNIIMRRYL